MASYKEEGKKLKKKKEKQKRPNPAGGAHSGGTTKSGRSPYDIFTVSRVFEYMN